MIYHDWVLSGKGVKGTVSSGDEAYDTIVRNSASLRVSSGGYIERTHILNNATVSNAGSAVDTFISGGVMQLLNGGVATNVQVLRNARLTVSSGAVATNVTVESGFVANVNATVYGDDSVTRIEGSNELGSFFLSGGTASNFLLQSLGMLTVSSGGTALDTEIRINGALTVSNGGVATGIVMSRGGKLNTTVRGGDAQTLVSGTNDSGTFLLSGGVATDFILYENATQYVSNGGIAIHTLISSTWAHQFVSSGGLASLTSVCDKGSMTVYGGGVARDTVISAGGSMMAAGGYISGAVVSGMLQATTATTGPDESGGSSVLENILVVSGGTLEVAANAKYSGTIDIFGALKIFGGVTVNGLSVSSGGSAVVGGTFVVATSSWNTTVVSGGKVTVSSGGEACGVTTVSGGGLLTVESGGTAADVVQKAGGRINAVVRADDAATLLAGSNESGTFLLSDGSASGFIVYSGAALTVSNGGVAIDAVVSGGGSIGAVSGATLYGLATVSGAVVYLASGAVLAGTELDIAESTVRCGGSEMLGMTASAGAIYDLGADGKAYDLTVGDGVVVSGALAAAGERLSALAGATVADTTIAVGGALTLEDGAETAGKLYFDFSGASSGALDDMVNDLSLVSSETAIGLVGLVAGGIYTVDSSGTDRTVFCMPTEIYDNAVESGGICVNAFARQYYTFDGESVQVTDLPVTSYSSAKMLDSDTELVSSISGVNDRGAIWTDFSVSSGAAIRMVDDDFGGDAWLTLEGTNLSGTMLYGTENEVYLSGGMNMLLTSGAIVGNLAAGAGANGAVCGVKLTIDDATLEGVSYAGGFGAVGYFDYDAGYFVTEDVTTVVNSGTFMKDFYAGALANYAKTGTTTDVGDVTLTVKNGTFKGNLYGASAVKAGSTGSYVHFANDVTVTIENGAAEKDDFCLFAAGYATGTSHEEAYIVNDVSLTIRGGDWGEATNGRGIFGGILASSVEAEVSGNVSITITGGTMGNVFGGGWAQKGGASVVGNVTIDISGDAEVVNVFGGGSHSYMEGRGTTTVGDVAITVSGGDVTGSIFARGRFNGDAAGSAEVVFTGENDYGCNVYGYTYGGGEEDPEAGEAALELTDYTGTLSGEIGGFAEGVKFERNTRMTIASAEDAVISNRSWIFDAAERDAAFSDAAFLNWAKADFSEEGTVIALNLADGDTNEWSLVRAAAETVYNKFDVQIDGVSILGETIGLDVQIADTGTDYDGWGFTVEGGTLKFKQLAQA